MEEQPVSNPNSLPSETKVEPCQVDNPDISRRMQKRIQELKQKPKGELTVAERLMLRAHNQRMTISLPDGDDTIEVQFRVPLACEFDEIIRLQALIVNGTKSGNVTMVESNSDRLFEMMADLAVDESMDKEFFRSGCILMSDLVQFIKEIMTSEQEKIQEVKSFRKN